MPSTQLKTLLNRIHNQDCVQGLQRIADNSVHLAFADPPFNIGYKYDVYHDSQESMHYLQWCNQWMAELFRVLKPDGTFWLAIGDEYAAELKISAQSLGFQLRSWVIWYYTFGVHCTNKFTRSHAHLFYFTKHPKNFTFNREEISVPSARQLIYGDKRANPRGRVPDDTWILRPQDAQDSFQADEDIWYFPRVNGTFKERAGFHGCQMPEQLLGRIIRGCSNENDVVLDPFSGSATTLVVAKKLHRKFIGFELSDDYALRGTERLDRTLAGDKLEGAEDPKTSVKATTTKANPREESLQINSLRRGFDPSFMRALDPHHIEPLRKAFLKASQGQRAGQTIIDPTLNTEFQNACDELAIELSGLERNVGILQLSSRGELDLPSGADEPSPSAPRRASASPPPAGIDVPKFPTNWYAVDASLYASEIAWRMSLERTPTASLEEIFSNPQLAAGYDKIARNLAGGFQPTELRRNALFLRDELSKEASRWSEQGKKSSRRFPSKDLSSVTVSDLAAKKWPSIAAIYRVVDAQGEPLYQSTTLNLARRIKNQFSRKAWKQLEPWCGPAESLRLEWKVIDISLARPVQQMAGLLTVPTPLNLYLDLD